MLETDSACISGTSVPGIADELWSSKYPVNFSSGNIRWRESRTQLYYPSVGSESIAVGPITDSGSPALLMKAARFRLGASENPQGNQGRQLCWRPGIIESAGEP
jgi:hypothetical protein